MLRVDDEIFQRYPGLRIGTVVVDGIDNRRTDSGWLEQLRQEEESARQRLGDGPLIEHSSIAPWREVYRDFGAKPKKYPSSIEALLRRVQKGQELPAINPLVDLYNTISLRYMVPVGGEDVDRIEGPFELRFADDSEPEVELLGRPVAAAPQAGEVIYSDQVGAVCRRFNWREAARTCLSPETSRAILVIEVLPPGDERLLSAALADLVEGVTSRCGGRCETAILGPAV